MNDPIFEPLFYGIIGIGLAAACGFRVFVPLLIVSIGVRADALQLASGFDWLGSDAALVMLGVATALEIGGYYVPWIDNLLDSIATPAAAIAGTMLSASMLSGMDPTAQWAIAIIGGGGSATAVQVLSVGTRAISTMTTGGLGNPVVSTAEAGASTGLSLAMVVFPPVLAALCVLAFAGLIVFWFVRRRKRRRLAVTTITPPALIAA